MTATTPAATGITDSTVLADQLTPYLPPGWGTHLPAEEVAHLHVVGLTDPTGTVRGYVLHTPGRRSPYAARAGGRIADWIADPAAAVHGVLDMTAGA